MTFQPTFHYSWQNPVLRASIYPHRNEKLRDFLLIYREIDLWASLKNQAPDPDKLEEISREYERLKGAIAEAKLQWQHAEAATKVLQAQHRQVLGSDAVRLLQRQKNMLLQRRREVETRMQPFERQVDWYRRFAPEHPYLQKWEFELEKLFGPLQEVQEALQQVDDQLAEHLGDFLRGMRDLESQKLQAQQKLQAYNLDLSRLPPLTPSGQVTNRTVVLWEIARYRSELEKLEHDDLVRAVVGKFDEQPERFPDWLRYMVLHFSGMRYRSAHGSWADPRDLLEMLQLEMLRKENEAATEEEISLVCEQALQVLGREKLLATDQKQRDWINYQIMGLMSLNRRKALLKFVAGREVEKIRGLSDERALAKLKEMHTRQPFPDWVWAEIVARTNLRLEVTDPGWEELTQAQREARWARENARWREIMNTWESKDITGWRQQHWLTLSLIVTRAVCNEIAEHIQHLRGVKPGAGLTAKPTWYLNLMRKRSGEAYFRRPVSSEDFKQGASILFLGWTDQRPSPWQIAVRLPDIELLPEVMRPLKSVRKTIAKRKTSQGKASDEWDYRLSGNEYVRTMRPYIKTLIHLPDNQVKKLKKQGRSESDIRNLRKEKLVRGGILTEWLRWTHEAIVIEVAELTSGAYVLTFETGKIGINLRPTRRLLGAWDIFVGYTPPAPTPPDKLDDMLERGKLLPPGREDLDG